MWVWLLLGLAVFVLQAIWQFWAHRMKPDPFWSAPFLGDSWSFFKNPSAFCLQRHHRYGSFTRAKILDREVFMVADPEGVTQVFAAEGKEVNLWAPDGRCQLEGVAMGGKGETKGIVLRKELLSLFTPSTLSDRYYRDAHYIIRSHIHSWTSKGDLPPQASSTLAFALLYGCLIDRTKAEDKKKMELCDKIVKCYTNRIPPPFQVADNTSFKVALKAKEELREGIKQLFMEALERRKKLSKEQEGEIQTKEKEEKGKEKEKGEDDEPSQSDNGKREGNDYRPTVIDMLVQMKEDMKEGEHAIDTSYDELIDALLQILLAGYQALVPTIQNTMELLKSNPQVLENVQTIVHKVAPGHGGLTYEQVHAMPYVDAVVKEVLRMRPPIEFSFKVVEREGWKVGPYTLHKGDMVLIHYPSLHHLSFTAPDIFDPARFDVYSPTYSTLYAHDNRRAYHPFGGGSRGCTGMKFANMVLRTFVAVFAKEGSRWEKAKPAQKDSRQFNRHLSFFRGTAQQRNNTFTPAGEE